MWAGDLVDYTGTPVDSQLAVWTDTDTIEGDSDLTFDGTFRVTGSSTLNGYVTLPSGLSSSMGTSITGVDRAAAGEWVKVAEAVQPTNYYATAVIDVMLAGYDLSSEIYQARVHLRSQPGAVTYSVCQTDIIQDVGTEAWDTGDFVLTQKTSATYKAQLWVRSPAIHQRCYATITNGSSDGSSAYKADWYLTPGQTWGTYSSAGSDITTTNVRKRFDSLGIDGDLQVTGSLTSNSAEIITSDENLTDDRALFVQNTADHCNIQADAAASHDSNIVLSENTGVKWSIGNDNSTDNLRFRDDGWVSRAELTQAGDLQIDGDLTVSTAGSSVAQETWTGASFATNWQDYSVSYQPVSYFKDSMGLVHLRGLAKCTTGTTPGTTIFTLPVGYRPAKIEMFAVRSNDAAGVDSCRLDVNAAGAVSTSTDFTPASSAWISLSGILFDTR